MGVDFRDALLTFYLIDCPLSSQERWQNWILDTRPSFQNHQGTLVPCNTGVMESDRWELLVITPPPPVSPQLCSAWLNLTWARVTWWAVFQGYSFSFHSLCGLRRIWNSLNFSSFLGRAGTTDALPAESSFEMPCNKDFGAHSSSRCILISSPLGIVLVRSQCPAKAYCQVLLLPGFQNLN